MNLSSYWLQFAEASGAVVAAGCALWVTMRDGRRIKSGEAKAMSARIDQAQQAADRWHESDKGQFVFAKLDKFDAQLRDHGAQLENVATKVDVARMEGVLNGLQDKVVDAAGGVDRIEAMLMKKAMERS